MNGKEKNNVELTIYKVPTYHEGDKWVRETGRSRVTLVWRQRSWDGFNTKITNEKIGIGRRKESLFTLIEEGGRILCKRRTEGIVM